MTRPKISAKVLDAHQRHKRILTILARASQPRSYFKNLGLSRSLKWLEEHGQVETSRTANVYITDAGRDRIKADPATRDTIVI